MTVPSAINSTNGTGDNVTTTFDEKTTTSQVTKTIQTTAASSRIGRTCPGAA
ncbi:hypothetical protein X777_05185 [Ooceraea biroi]|uniref:Uncharacterized protein n=1 Tax=Ooceraea biroi TaxID=2015173 RepID=A0A026WGT9_OOCBI|nr:hypothetical protein X777_05185 [Ooceraea biroi]